MRSAEFLAARREVLRGAVADRLAVLIGCGKSKATTATEARHLYTSPLFRKELELAELVGDAVFVTSARHGLVELDDVVSPYDFTLIGASKETRSTWARVVIDELERRTLGGAGRVRVVLLMGAAYSRPLVDELERRRGRLTSWAPPVDLLSGLEIGERLSYLNKAIATLKKAGSK